MKKLALSIVAVVLAVASVFCFTACGDTPEQKLKNYIESDTFQSQIDSMKSSFESMMDVDVKAEGEKLLMKFDLKQDLPEETIDTIKTQLDSSFESSKSTFEAIADTIKKEVNIETPQVIVEINTKDGKNLVSKTFGASESK